MQEGTCVLEDEIRELLDQARRKDSGSLRKYNILVDQDHVLYRISMGGALLRSI